MTFGKSSPDQLWSVGPATAELQTNWGDPGAYVQGYFDAASHLADEMAENRLGIDIVVYPALYLFRHGLELGFKALLRGYSYELDLEPTLGRSGHSLAMLWQELKPLLETTDWHSQLDPGRASAAVTIGDIDALVYVLHEVDPTGEAARYDTSRQGEPTLSGVWRVNLLVFRDLCTMCGDWMGSVLDAREEVVAFIRSRRRERGEE